jgi:RAB protein geranylgeranyltransferase component A
MPGSSAVSEVEAEVMNIGGFEKVSNVGGGTFMLKTFIDPFTGKVRRETLKISSANLRKGETVFRNVDSQGRSSGETFVLDLGTLVET